MSDNNNFETPPQKNATDQKLTKEFKQQQVLGWQNSFLLTKYHMILFSKGGRYFYFVWHFALYSSDIVLYSDVIDLCMCVWYFNW